VESFFTTHAVRDLSKEEKIKVLKLLEMQRHAMLMYNSCGWFFDEISGIETVQLMQYASRAMQLANETGGYDLEPQYLNFLEKALSNVKDYMNGARVWELFVKPATVDLLRVGAHYAVSSLFEEYPKTSKVFCYTTSSEIHDVTEAGIQKIAIGKARVRSDITMEEMTVSFAVLHLGDHNVIGGVREYMGDDPFTTMREETKEAFMKSDISKVIHLLDKHFEGHNYSLWHLFKDEQRKIVDQILDSTLGEIETSFRQIYERHYPIMQMMREIRFPLPKAFTTSIEFILNKDMRTALEEETLDFEVLQKLVDEFKQWQIDLDNSTVGFVASNKINTLMEKLWKTPEDVSLLEEITTLFTILSTLPLKLDLWKAQNIYFSVSGQYFDQIQEKAKNGDQNSKTWIEHFTNLGEYLHVRIT